jgi:hypothetical protein
MNFNVVKRGRILAGGRIEVRYVEICECDAPRMLANVTKGICGNCNGARGPDCKGLNKPIKEVQQQAIAST